MTVEYETLDRCILCGGERIRLYDAKSSTYRCGDCGVIFDNPRPSGRSIALFYSAKDSYIRKLDKEAAHQALSRRQVKDVLRFARGGDLLDVGAGYGQFLLEAKNYFNVWGTEVSSEAVALARKKYGIELFHGEVERFAEKENRRFDVVTLFQVIEHFPYPGRALDACISLLKPGGLLYIAAPNESCCSLRRILPGLFSAAGIKKFRPFSIRGLRKIDCSAMNEIHVSHFSEKIIRRCLEKRGMKILGCGVDFLDPYSFKSGLVQIPRHILYYASLLIRLITRMNIYNGLWIAARKMQEF